MPDAKTAAADAAIEQEREYGSPSVRGPARARSLSVRRDYRARCAVRGAGCGPPAIVIVSIHLSYHNLDCLINSGTATTHADLGRLQTHLVQGTSLLKRDGAS